MLTTNYDVIQRFMFDHHPVRGEIVRLQDSYQQIIKQHHYPKVIAQLLGESLLAVTLLYGMTKYPGCFTLEFQGTGDLQLLSVRCTHDFRIRGCARWQGVLNSTHHLAKALGQGRLLVTFVPERDGHRYQSVIPVEGVSIAAAMEAYFAQSEQLPTKLLFAIDHSVAVGMMLQALPNRDPQCEHSWQHVTTLADTLSTAELLTTDSVTVLHRLYHQEEVRMFQEDRIQFGCGCSVQRMQNAIALAGREEIEQLLVENQFVEVACEFCGNSYQFDEGEVKQIFEEHLWNPTSKTVH